MSPRQSNIALIAANILFGISYTLIVDLVNHKIAFQTLFILLIVSGAAVFVPLALTKWQRVKESLKQAPLLIIYSIITIYGWSYLTLMGSQHTTSLDIAALSTLGPTVTIVAAALQKNHDNKIKHLQPNFVRTFVTPLILLCIVTIIVIGDIKTETPNTQILGNLIVAVGVVSMGISTVVAKKLHRKYGTLILLGWYFAIGTLLIPLVVPNWYNEVNDLCNTPLELRSKIELALLPLLDMIIPIYLLYRGSRNLTPLHTALYRYIQPVIALIVLITSNITQLYTTLPSLKSLASTLLVTLVLLLLATFIMPRNEVE